MSVELSSRYERKPTDLKRAPNTDKAASRRSHHYQNSALKPIAIAYHEPKPKPLQRPTALHGKMPAHWDAKVDALLQQAIQTIDNYMRQTKQATQPRHSGRQNRNGAKRHNAISRKDWRGCTATEQKQYKRASLRSWRNINCLLYQTQQSAKYLGNHSNISTKQQ